MFQDLAENHQIELLRAEIHLLEEEGNRLKHHLIAGKYDSPPWPD